MSKPLTSTITPEQWRELCQLVGVEPNGVNGELSDPEELLKTLRTQSQKTDPSAEVQALDLRNRHLENVLRSMSSLVLVINLKGQVTMVNRKVVESSGCTEAELLGSTITKLLEDPDNQAADLEPNRDYRLFFRRKNGNSFPVALTVAPMQNRPGEMPSLVCVAHDLTDIHEAEMKLRESEHLFRNLVETMQEGVLLVDTEDRIKYCNLRFCKMTGYSEAEMVGQFAGRMILLEEDQKELQIRIGLRKRRRSEVYEQRIKRKDGRIFWARVSASPVIDAHGKVVGSIGLHEDISFRKEAREELESSLREKEMLLKEVHHRVKNNLQVISSLLSLQSHNVNNEQAELILRDSQNRIKSMAAIHEKLYQSDNLARIDFADYCSQIVYQLAISFGISSRNVKIESDIRDVVLGVDQAVPCGLILNELVSNAMKYAFSEDEGGIVKIHFRREESGYFLTVSDNGVGLPEDIDIFDTPTLGFQLVSTLVDQLDGKMELFRENGTRFEIRFETGD